MLNPPIGRLRLIGWVEGVSFILLLGIAMPLKYIWGEPLAVRIVGGAHGALWMALCVALADTRKQEGWSWQQLAVPFVASMVPFCPFLIDRRLREAEQGQ